MHLIFRTAAAGFATPCVVAVQAAQLLLHCPVTGTTAGRDFEERIAEAIEVEIDEEQWLTINVRGRSLTAFLTAKSASKPNGNTIVARNLSNEKVWELANHSKIDGIGIEQSIRIDARTGSLVFSQRSRLILSLIHI